MVEQNREENFEKFGQVVETVARALVPDVAFKLDLSQDQRAIVVDVAIDDEEAVGLFLGRRLFNLKTLRCFIRGQQVYPHDRLVVINVHKGEGGEIQTFTDYYTTRNRGAKDLFEQEAHYLRRKLSRELRDEEIVDVVAGGRIGKILSSNGVEV